MPELPRNQGARQPLGRGRPSTGVTRKASLTLPQEVWAEIEASGKTLAAYLLELRDKPPVTVEVEKVAEVPTPVSGSSKFTRRDAEYLWNLFIGENKDLDQGLIDSAKRAYYRNLFPRESEFAVTNLKHQFQCPFTGKWFGSMEKLSLSAMPWLVEFTKREIKQHADYEERNAREENSPHYFMGP